MNWEGNRFLCQIVQVQHYIVWTPANLFWGLFEKPLVSGSV